MMKPWIKLSTAALVASVLVACGGSGGADEEAVTLLSQMQPGERFAMETPLLGGGSQISHYVVHGVTPEGDLADSDRPGLLEGARVSILESVTRDGRNSASLGNPALSQPTSIHPDILRKQQQAFYRQLWDAMAEHEGTRDPRVLLAEIDDLDTRIVDLMDDVGASGVTLRTYIAFYDRLDALPEFSDKELAELNLHETLSDMDKYSVFEAAPPACATGLTRVVSQSGLSSYCRLASSMHRTALSEARATANNALAALTEPNLRALIAAAPTEPDIHHLLYASQLDRTRRIEESVRSNVELLRQKQELIDQQGRALAENREDDQRWKTYCAQHPELGCVSVNTPRFGSVMHDRVRGMQDSLIHESQLTQFQVQRLMMRRNEVSETMSTLLEKFQDQRTAIISNLR